MALRSLLSQSLQGARQSIGLSRLTGPCLLQARGFAAESEKVRCGASHVPNVCSDGWREWLVLHTSRCLSTLCYQQEPLLDSPSRCLNELWDP